MTTLNRDALAQLIHEDIASLEAIDRRAPIDRRVPGHLERQHAVQVLREYLSLRDERDALRAENARLHHENARLAALLLDDEGYADAVRAARS